mmetsp:Transcript_96599/g.207232  ORF Transcript_96599/g.207232 Transcript_96599/m.207232 type:complete len:203 (+) Transcript_96599:672-1280(+)
MWDELGRRREIRPDTVLENDRLELVLHLWVHHGAVPIAVHVLLETLRWPTPLDLHSCLCIGQLPLHLDEIVHEPLRILVCDEVHEGISEAEAGVEVEGHVDEVVVADEAHGIEQASQRIPAAGLRDIPDDHCGQRSRVLKILATLLYDLGALAALPLAATLAPAATLSLPLGDPTLLAIGGHRGIRCGGSVRPRRMAGHGSS